jgi:hypothetical protein
VNSGSKRRAWGKGHAEDRKFLTWAATATLVELRAKTSQLMRQKDFPDWKRIVLVRAIEKILGPD